MVPSFAVIVTVTWAATATVLTVNDAESLPAAIVTEAGRVAGDDEDERFTTKPPVGASPLSVTVPVAEAPPTTVAGASVNETNAGGCTVSVAIAEIPLAEPVITAEVWVATAVVLTVKVDEVLPADTVTVAGTVAFVELLLNLTTNPPFAAASVSFKVAVLDIPPGTAAGLTVTD